MCGIRMLTLASTSFATQEMTLRVACHIKSNMGTELQRLDFEKPLKELAAPIQVESSISKEATT